MKRATHTQSTHETHAHEEGRQKGKEANDQNNKPTRRKGKNKNPPRTTDRKQKEGSHQKRSPKGERRKQRTNQQPTITSPQGGRRKSTPAKHPPKQQTNNKTREGQRRAAQTTNYEGVSNYRSLSHSLTHSVGRAASGGSLARQPDYTCDLHNLLDYIACLTMQ